MIDTNVDKVISEAEGLIRQLELQSPAEKTSEWFAINNLNGFIERLRKGETKDDVINASRILSRFAVDSLEWGSELMKQVETISESGRKCAKQLA